MTKSELQLSFIAGCFFVAWCVMSYICYDYSHQVAKLENDIKSQLNFKNAEIEAAKHDLEEAQEWLGIVFNEGADITNKYNELKNKCRKVKR